MQDKISETSEKEESAPQQPTIPLQSQSSINLNFDNTIENGEAAGYADIKETPCFANDLSLPVATVVKIHTTSSEKIEVEDPEAKVDIEVKSADYITISRTIAIGLENAEETKEPENELENEPEKVLENELENENEKVLENEREMVLEVPMPIVEVTQAEVQPPMPEVEVMQAEVQLPTPEVEVTQAEVHP